MGRLQRGCREDGGTIERKRELLDATWGWRMHSNGPRDKEQDQCDSQLSPGL